MNQPLASLISSPVATSRICPGRFLSNASLAIYIASTLHVFNIAPGFDKAGNRIRLTTDVKTGLVA